jgi:hypothetical protein
LSAKFELEDKLERLVKMYPEYDKDVLRSLLELHGGSIHEVEMSIAKPPSPSNQRYQNSPGSSPPRGNSKLQHQLPEAEGKIKIVFFFFFP